MNLLQKGIAFVFVILFVALVLLMAFSFQSKKTDWNPLIILFDSQNGELVVTYKGHAEEGGTAPSNLDGSKVRIDVSLPDGGTESYTLEGIVEPFEKKRVAVPENAISIYVYYDDVLIERFGGGT